MVLLLLFTIDMLCYGILQQSVVCLLLSYYVCMLFGNCSYYWLSLTAATYMLSTFIVHGHFGIELIYLVPLSIIALFLKQFCNYQIWQSVLLASIALAAHQVIIAHILEKPPFFFGFYTIIKLLVILLVTIAFSLILQWYGTQGNRLFH